MDVLEARILILYQIFDNRFLGVACARMNSIRILCKNRIDNNCKKLCHSKEVLAISTGSVWVIERLLIICDGLVNDLVEGYLTIVSGVFCRFFLLQLYLLHMCLPESEIKINYY